MLHSDVSWGITPCAYCELGADALLEGEPVCLTHAVELIERAEAVAQFGDTARSVLQPLLPRTARELASLPRPLSPELERDELRTMRERFADGSWRPSLKEGPPQ